MKKINWRKLGMAVGLVIFGLFMGWLFFSSSETGSSEGHVHEEEDHNEIWTCSMHPQVRKNEPGQCPICGMNLIPVEQEGALNDQAVQMTPTAMKLAQVQTAIVGMNSSSKTVRLNGKVQAAESKTTTQSSHVSGRIEQLKVNFIGDFVKKGQIIAYVYSPELVSAQEELLLSYKMRDQQPDLLKSARSKLRNWKLTDDQINSIIQSQSLIEEFPIRANVSGYVTEKKVNTGDYVKQGEPIYSIADLSTVWIMFDVYESDIQAVQRGMKVNYSLQALPGEEFQGVITYIDPAFDPQTRAAQARVEVSNSSLRLKPEMFVTGRLVTDVSQKGHVIAVPKSAVLWTGKRSVVYVMKKDQDKVGFLMREVTLGQDLGDSYVIQSGLNAGEEIAVNGTFSIDAAAQLAGKPSMMNPEGSTTSLPHHHEGMQMPVKE